MSGTSIPASLPQPAKTGAQVPADNKSAQVQASHSEGKTPIQNQAAASAKAITGQNVPARELFLQTAAALGFPKDALSVTLLAFARFFSLSPSLLGSLRREFLNSGKTPPALNNQGNETPQGREKTVFEARALTAAAALDKGVTLSPEAQTNYSRYLIPPETPQEKKTGAEFSPGAGGGRNKGGDNEENEKTPEAEKIKAIAEEESKKDKLLDFLNKLPGKNSQHWAVFPFRIEVRGIELQVLLRILKRESLLAEESAFVIADISGPKRQWRCFLRERATGVQADLRVFPNVSERTLKRLKKEAERFLGEVTVGNRDESVSWVDDLYTESLPSVNKEV